MQIFLISTFVVLSLIVMTTNAGIADGVKGGLGESRPADDDVNEVVSKLRSEIIQKVCEIGGNCPASDAKITVNSYKTQVVSGTNYFVGATIGDASYHLKIYSQPWTDTLRVSSVQGPKQVDEEIAYF